MFVGTIVFEPRGEMKEIRLKWTYHSIEVCTTHEVKVLQSLNVARLQHFLNDIHHCNFLIDTCVKCRPCAHPVRGGPSYKDPCEDLCDDL